MKLKPEKALLLIAAIFFVVAGSYALGIISFTKAPAVDKDHIGCSPEHHVCVMKTMFELDKGPAHIKNINDIDLPAEVKTSVLSGQKWMAAAQLADGGWGAGFHAQQNIRDPHAVKADPATTSLVLLSLLRTGNSLDSGEYRLQVVKATEFLLRTVEAWRADQPKLTLLVATQPQQKLGENIDAILTVQYFTTLLKYHQHHSWKNRIETALQKCVNRIQKEQDVDGGWKGGGWAPVLQSALADQALESAKDAGIKVDSTIIAKSKKYQKGNFDVATNSAVTSKSAGVMLYSLSSTARSSSKEVYKAQKFIEKAKKEGKLKADDKLNEANLVLAGVAPADAKEMETAYFINSNAKTQSARQDIMAGFGSNGGEELISYLMTGETIHMQGGNDWKTWYDNMSKKILTIQKTDGSWEGHHCITSPVFCTAAALLILSIHNDMA